MPIALEVARLMQSISAFKERPPQDMPKGFMEDLDAFEKELSALAPTQGQTPGQKAAAAVGTGAHYSQAAKGPDQPTEGQ